MIAVNASTSLYSSVKFTPFGSDALTWLEWTKGAALFDADPRTPSQVPGKSTTATLLCRSKARYRISAELQSQIVDMALEQSELSPRELAVRFTDEKRYFVSRLILLLYSLEQSASPANVLATCFRLASLSALPVSLVPVTKVVAFETGPRRVTCPPAAFMESNYLHHEKVRVRQCEPSA